MSSRSLAVNASIASDRPGMFTPLCGPRNPPTRTRVRTSPAPTVSTTRSMAPSLSRMVSPALTACSNPGKLTEVLRQSPSIGSLVSVNGSPALSSTDSLVMLPVRSFGPARSPRMATVRPSSPASARMRATRATCSWLVPCEKLIRATSIPASIIAFRMAGSSLAGPIVHTILVRRMGFLLSRTDRPREVAHVPDDVAEVVSLQAVIIVNPILPPQAVSARGHRRQVWPSIIPLGHLDPEVDEYPGMVVTSPCAPSIWRLTLSGRPC